MSKRVFLASVSVLGVHVRNPSSPVAQSVDWAANCLTAAICKITKDAPAAVCGSPAARAGAGSL